MTKIITSNTLVIPDAHKKCPKCGETKPRTEFHVCSGYSAPYCKPCSYKYNSAQKKKHREKFNARERDRWAKMSPEDRYFSWASKPGVHGITKDTFFALYKKQGGVCPICNKELPLDFGKDIFVLDHCHSTKVIRGILCQLCNRGLGHFKDCQQTLQRAIQYLNSGGVTNE